ncbi:MAG: hypothetical protein ACLSG5_12015 [Oscillospiraceae bacterium]
MSLVRGHADACCDVLGVQLGIVVESCRDTVADEKILCEEFAAVVGGAEINIADLVPRWVLP